jgi:small GTP-binding protein
LFPTLATRRIRYPDPSKPHVILVDTPGDRFLFAQTYDDLAPDFIVLCIKESSSQGEVQKAADLIENIWSAPTGGCILAVVDTFGRETPADPSLCETLPADPRFARRIFIPGEDRSGVDELRRLLSGRPRTLPTSWSRKVIVVGDHGVGKTTIINQFTINSIDPNATAISPLMWSTAGIRIGEVLMRLLIYDTAGEERYDSWKPVYWRSAAAVIVVYDVTSEDSFTAVHEWIGRVDDCLSDPDVVFMLVGNKRDLERERMVSSRRGHDFAKNCGIMFKETTATNLADVTDLFGQVGAKLLERSAPPENAAPGRAALKPESSRCF